MVEIILTESSAAPIPASAKPDSGMLTSYPRERHKERCEEPQREENKKRTDKSGHKVVARKEQAKASAPGPQPPISALSITPFLDFLIFAFTCVNAGTSRRYISPSRPLLSLYISRNFALWQFTGSRRRNPRFRHGRTSKVLGRQMRRSI